MEKAPQRQDLSELVSNPPVNSESYWHRAGELVPTLGTLALTLSKEETKAYVDRLRTIEETIGILPLSDSPQRLHEQIRISPKDFLQVNLVDYNSSYLYSAHEEVLRQYAKGKKRPIAMQAYHRLGGINQANDLGFYLLPFVSSVVMKGFLDKEKSIQGLEDQSIGLLLGLLDEFNSGHYKEAGSVFQHFRTTAVSGGHLPGSVSVSSAVLMEIGSYFSDFDEIVELDGPRLQRRGNEVESLLIADELAEGALRTSLELLRDRNVLNQVNKQVRSQLDRRFFDVAFIELYRKAKAGFIDADETLEEFANLQLAYIRSMEKWMQTSPDEEGITFEWLVALILRHHQFRQGLIADGYVHYGSPREDFPEDGLPGNSSGNSQSLDVFWKHNQKKHFIQCKLRQDGKYVKPITTVDARPLAGDNSRYQMLDYFRNTVTEIKHEYELLDCPESTCYREFEEVLVNTVVLAA